MTKLTFFSYSDTYFLMFHSLVLIYVIQYYTYKIYFSVIWVPIDVIGSIMISLNLKQHIFCVHNGNGATLEEIKCLIGLG